MTREEKAIETLRVARERENAFNTYWLTFLEQHVYTGDAK